MIGIVILAIYALLFIVAYGIRFKVKLDLNNMNLCFKCFILDYIEVFYVNLILCQGKFYYQINKKDLKVVEQNDNNTITYKSKRSKKLKTAPYIAKLWAKRPNLTVKKVNVDYSIAFEDIKNRALFDGCAMIFINSVLAINREKLVVKDFELNKSGNIGNLNGVDLDIVMGFAIFKIVAYAIYATLIKKKYQVKA